jgi:hypothetical protein
MSQELQEDFTFSEGKENYQLVDGVYLPTNVKVPAQILAYAKGIATNNKTVVINLRGSGRLGETLSVSYINWYPCNKWVRTDDAAIVYVVGEEVIHNLAITGEVDYINKLTVEVSLEDLAE